MKRRDFFKSAAILTASAGVLGFVDACTDKKKEQTKHEEPKRLEPKVIQRPPSEIVKDIENEFLKVTVYSDATFVIYDKKNDYEWKTAPVAIQDEGGLENYQLIARSERYATEQFPGHFIGTKRADLIEFLFLGRQDFYKGRFTCSVALDNAWLCFRIVQVNGKFPVLSFPPPILSDKLVLPVGAGMLLDGKHVDYNRRTYYSLYEHLNMRWIGGLKEKMGWIGVFDLDSVNSGAMVVNNQVSPVWLSSMQKWNGSFGIRYRFVKGSYVELAKLYRQCLIDTKQFALLDDKLKKHELLKSVIGGRILNVCQCTPPFPETDAEDLYLISEKSKKNKDKNAAKNSAKDPDLQINYTHKELQDLVHEAKRNGLKKGILNINGWMGGGADSLSPDVWPPENMLGSIDDFQKLLNLDDEIISCLQDNYQDIYARSPSFPNGVNIRPDKTMMTGLVKAGGQSYILNSSAALIYAKRNWDQIKQVAPKAVYLHSVAATRMLESHDNENPQMRVDDLNRRVDLFNFFKSNGYLLGCEGGADFAIKYADWFENWHTRTEGQTVPLWSLVYHDSALCFRHSSFASKHYNAWLEDMLWGYGIRCDLTQGFQSRHKPNGISRKDFQQSFEADKWHKRIASAEMTDHHFLTSDGSVEETTFDNGLSIICNFGTRYYHGHGTSIAPGKYKIKG